MLPFGGSRSELSELRLSVGGGSVGALALCAEGLCAAIEAGMGVG